MDLKRKVPLHLDAAILLAIVFVCSLGFNLFQMYQVVELNKETSQQGVQAVLDQMNLDEALKRVKVLEQSCELQDGETQ
ncbi:hypothetical protein ACMXYX_09325 [Neptuniibacter sp. QD72_48]|uniref:hypothetical protein n=1 Tax=unclassified Neptuniibacter TaxID=2630693 RepID=UPI0039F53F73